jgi:catechol 2,3-dioxygenase-like lactoylglutathione lyase family enzyme
MRIWVMSVFVDDQGKAGKFYTEKLGFAVKHDIPMGSHRWLTLVSKDAPEGTELLLEPNEHPAIGPYQSALANDGVPAASFQVDDLKKEFERLSGLGVKFTVAPRDAGTVRMAVLDDTCGNLIQLVELIKEKSA